MACKHRHPRTHHKATPPGDLPPRAEMMGHYYQLSDGTWTKNPQKVLAEVRRLGRPLPTIRRLIRTRRYTGEDLSSVVIDCEHGAPFRPLTDN
jgi:hypothetical protein